MSDATQEFDAPASRMNFEKIRTAMIWLAVIGAGAWFATNYFLNQSRENHAVQIRQQKTEACIAALALKYNAVTNWEASLPDRGGDSQPFSIDILSALSGGNPTLMRCTVKDLSVKEGKIVASLSSVDTANNLFIELQCNPAQTALFESTNQLSDFAVILKCQEVKRLSADNEGFSVKAELVDAVQLPGTDP